MQRIQGHTCHASLRIGVFFLLVLGLSLPCLQPVLAQQGEAEVLLAQATIAYDEKRYDEALSLLTQAHERDPQNARVLYYLGLTNLALNQPAIAKQHLQAARQLKPDDMYIRTQLGFAYFALHDYDQAEPLLFEAYDKDPQMDGLGFCVGFLRYREKDYKDALTAFDTAKSSNPNIRQLTHFYSGMTKGVLGLPEQAIVELDESLRTGAVSPLTQGAIQLRDALAAGKQASLADKRFTARLSLGVYYDDNVAINPDKTGFIPNQNVGGIVDQNTTISSLRRRQTSAPGILVSILGDYAFLKKGPWEATATYSFFQTLNFNSLDDFNIQDHTIGTAGFYRGTLADSDLPYQLSVQYTYDYLFLDSKAFLARHTPTVTATLVGPIFELPFVGQVGSLTTAQYRFQVKTFFRETSNVDVRFATESRDAFNNMIGVVHAVRFADDRMILRIGYQYDNESTDGSAFSYTGDRLLTGGQATLPWGGIAIRYDYDVHWRNYKNAQTLFTNRHGVLRSRYDTQQTHLVQVIKPLPHNISLAFQYQRIRNQSRVPIYDYTKNAFTVIANWTY
ncbi:MAG: tetratricopeptide repeat protein [Nitrospirales bacterium]|nr:tetratricopeptide repeat protein [Nitrospira sp.]MDR4501562.1 tetratricopeptide repeat protein [Nitrospirales bacterium]